jgi:hypothetical protein
MFRIPSSLGLLALTLLVPSLGTAAPIWIDSLGKGCTGSSFRLDNFSGEVAGLPNKNRQGGYWYAFTDTTSGTPGLANGVSTLSDDSITFQGVQYIAGDEANMGYAGISATLDKGDSVVHPEAGWAQLGTYFLDKATGKPSCMDLTYLRAISFYVSMPGDFDGTNLVSDFDDTNLVGVNLRIGNGSVADSVAFAAGIPYSKFNHQMVCLDVSQFRQPNGNAGLSMRDIYGLFWELKIRSGATRAKPSSVYIGNVTLWGEASLSSGRTNGPWTFSSTPCEIPNSMPLGVARKSGSAQGSSRLSATYSKGLRLNYALGGTSPVAIEILRLDGRKVASFAGTASASNLTLPISLSRGTYLAVVRSGTSKLVAPFAVAQ